MKIIINFSLFVLLTSLIFSCKEKGEGSLVNGEVQIHSFKSIEVNVHGQVYVEYGQKQYVYIEAQQNVINALSTKIDKDLWKIKLNTPISDYDLKIHIVTPEIKRCDINGSAVVTVMGPHSRDGKFRSDVSGSGTLRASGMNALHKEVSLNVSGDGFILLEGIETKDLRTNISGSASVQFEGSASKYYARISGSSNVSDYNLVAREVDMVNSGSGTATLTCTNKLKAKVEGSASIYYKGNPSEVNTTVDGTGRIVSVL